MQQLSLRAHRATSLSLPPRLPARTRTTRTAQVALALLGADAGPAAVSDDALVGAWDGPPPALRRPLDFRSLPTYIVSPSPQSPTSRILPCVSVCIRLFIYPQAPAGPPASAAAASCACWAGRQTSALGACRAPKRIFPPGYALRVPYLFEHVYLCSK